jgi:hypothetical protein
MIQTGNKSLDRAIRAQVALFATTRRRERAKAIQAGSLPACTTKELAVRGEEVLRSGVLRPRDRPASPRRSFNLSRVYDPAAEDLNISPESNAASGLYPDRRALRARCYGPVIALPNSAFTLCKAMNPQFSHSTRTHSTPPVWLTSG